jgi:pimeloyl-ACP methyl ester carboxylesterase
VPLARNGEVDLYYEVHGEREAPVLILVPGLAEQIGGVEFPVEQVQLFVEAGFRVVRVDCRDAGLSTSCDGAGRPDLDEIVTALSSGEVPVVPYTYLDMADDVIAVADDMGASRVHLVGASGGGMVVRWAAIRRPQRVVSLTVIMSGSGAMPGDDGPQLDPDVLGDLLGLGDHRPGPGYIPYHVEFWRNQWGTTFAFDEAWVTERVTETFERSYRPDGAYRQLLAGAGSLGLWDAQRSIKQPVLIVHGSADPVFAPDHALATAAQIPNADLWLVEGMGHSMHAEIWPELTQRISVLTSLH